MATGSLREGSRGANGRMWRLCGWEQHVRKCGFDVVVRAIRASEVIREQDDIHSAGATIARKQSVWNQNDDEISAISQFAAFCAVMRPRACGGEFDAGPTRVV